MTRVSAALLLAAIAGASCAGPTAAPPSPLASATVTVTAPAATSASPAPPAPSATPTASAAPAAGGLAPTHRKPECNAGERRFFACDAKEGAAARRIVVCGADLGKPDASLALVLGEPARTEVEVRVPVSADGTLVRYARYTRPRVTYLRAAFTQGGETFEISDDSNEEEARAERVAELVITMGPQAAPNPGLAPRAPGKASGKPERVIRCTGKPKDSLMGLEDHLKMQEPWF
jgi:hypothetical protein